MTMTFKEYLTTDEAEAYLSSKSILPATFKDLKQLERIGKIKPVIYLDSVGFLEDFGNTYKSISGYFTPYNFIFFDRYRNNPYRDFYNMFYEVKFNDLFEVTYITEHSNNKPKINTLGTLLTPGSHPPFEIKRLDEIHFDCVFIKRTELDKLFQADSQNDERQTTDKLNQRIKQLEQQLEQRQLTQRDVNLTYTTPAIEVMNAVINEFWLNYNTDNPAPKQDTIKAWIKDNYNDISDALALSIDKVCRHPKAKKGGQFKK